MPTTARRPHVGSRLLSLAAGTMLDVGPADGVDVAARAGFPAVGIWFDASTWTDGVAADVARRLDATGLVALDVEPVMLGRGVDHGEAIVDAALRVGARHVLVASRETDEGVVAERLGELAVRAEGTSLRIVLEFLPALGIRTLAQAARIVDAVAHPAVGVLIDALHLVRAGETADDVRRIGATLPYLQLCDAPATIADDSAATLIDEALHRRLLPGDGEVDLDGLLAAVPDVPLSFEIRSDALVARHPDPVERARAVLGSVQR